MKLYLSVIGVSMLLLSLCNILMETAAWYTILLSVLWCTVFSFALDGLIALIIHAMPDKWFGVDNPLYRVSKAEMAFYKKIKVRRWKDKVWDLGGLGGFSKKRLKQPHNPQYIEKFIIECNKGVLTHRLSYPIGFFALLLLPAPCAYTVALPVALIHLFLNILPSLVLRYNTPMLRSVLKRMKSAQKCEAEKLLS